MAWLAPGPLALGPPPRDVLIFYSKSIFRTYYYYYYYDDYDYHYY